MKRTIYTIGHSTHTADEFVSIIHAHGIETVVDVRSVPGSRHNPQFNKEELEKTLREQKMDYVHLKALGGLRHTTKASVNTGWRNASFRGFADYMQTPEFAGGIEELIELAREKKVAIMCSEAVPWRCHRSLIGDALLVRGFHVEDIMSAATSKPHSLTPWAKVAGKEITYPGVI
ncbi:MAG TPA: DUF488 domain-containing protein [Syntrophales bacterium]|nr:DUF488 domain-containing protein [Syntrophales bacterium]